MPIPNIKGTPWHGYLVDDISEHALEFLDRLQNRLEGEELPKVELFPAKTKMWYRSNSPTLDVNSKLDGEMRSTIHAMDYGNYLFVGVAFMWKSLEGVNYYRNMAANIFMEILDRYVVERLLSLLSDLGIEKPSYKAIGKTGRME